MATMFGTFNFLSWARHLAYGPISSADVDAGVRIFFTGLLAGVAIMIVGKIDAAAPRRAVIQFTGAIVTLVSFVGLLFCIGGQF